MKYILISVVSIITVFFPMLVWHNYIMETREVFQEDLALDVTKHINEYRMDYNLAPVVTNYITCDLATARAIEISKGFSHELFLDRFGISPYYTNVLFGENLSRNYHTGEEIVNAWINSQRHKEILRAEFEYGCVVCYKFHCAFNTVKLLKD